MLKGKPRNKRQNIGGSLLNKIIDKLPIELHVPNYQYCGPGTNLRKRLARGDQGINPLDAACKRHDIAYEKSKETKDRYLADGELQSEAMKRVFARDASLGERATALAVTAAMKAKRSMTTLGKGIGQNIKKIKRSQPSSCCIRKRKKKSKTVSGKGLKRKTKTKKKKKTISFANLVKDAKIAIKKSNPNDVYSAVQVAVKSVNSSKRGKSIKQPRIIKLPTYSGGILPLIPIFAGLGALGSIVGSATGVIKALNEYKDAKNNLNESKRHNKAMEAIAIGKGYFLSKRGSGYFLKHGKGYFLSRSTKNQ